MKIESDKEHIKIKGDNFGDRRYIKVYCSSREGEDYYSITLVKDGGEIGCLPSLTITHHDIICQNNMDKGRNIL